MDHEGANADVLIVTQRDDLRIEGIDFEGMLLSEARRHFVPPTAEGQFGLVWATPETVFVLGCYDSVQKQGRSEPVVSNFAVGTRDGSSDWSMWV